MPNDWTPWILFAKEVGLPVAILLFMVWELWRERRRTENQAEEREKRLQTRIDESEKRYVELLSQSIKATNNNTAAMEQIVFMIRNRPCLHDLPQIKEHS